MGSGIDKYLHLREVGDNTYTWFEYIIKYDSLFEKYRIFFGTYYQYSASDTLSEFDEILQKLWNQKQSKEAHSV